MVVQAVDIFVQVMLVVLVEVVELALLVVLEQTMIQELVETEYQIQF